MAYENPNYADPFSKDCMATFSKMEDKSGSNQFRFNFDVETVVEEWIGLSKISDGIEEIYEMSVAEGFLQSKT